MILQEDLRKILELWLQFLELWDKYRDILNTESELYNTPGVLFDTYIYTIFNDEGSDLVFWWIYEDVDKIIYEDSGETDVNKLDDFLNYLYKHQKDYFKNG